MQFNYGTLQLFTNSYMHTYTHERGRDTILFHGENLQENIFKFQNEKENFHSKTFTTVVLRHHVTIIARPARNTIRPDQKTFAN
jgi:hypothetical protein